MINIRNAIKVGNGRIDVEYEHPKFGWIPFTASQNDTEDVGREIYAVAVKIAANAAPAKDQTAEEIAENYKRLKYEADAQVAKADSKLQEIAAMSPAQVRSWIEKHATDSGAIADVLATLAVAVSVLSRKL